MGSESAGRVGGPARGRDSYLRSSWGEIFLFSKPGTRDSNRGAFSLKQPPAVGGGVQGPWPRGGWPRMLTINNDSQVLSAD